MIPESLAALAGLAKTAESLATTSSAVQRNSLLVEFLKGQNHAQQIISGLLAEKAALTAQVDKLEKAALEAKNWQAERENYVLRQVATGVFVQVRKDDKQPPESVLKLCPSCFEDGRKAVLQCETVYRERGGMAQSLTCSSCKSRVIFTYFLTP